MPCTKYFCTNNIYMPTFVDYISDPRPDTALLSHSVYCD